MKFKILEDGYLTSTQKKHIKFMFENKLKIAKINTINYFIYEVNDYFVVKKAIKDKKFKNGYFYAETKFKIN